MTLIFKTNDDFYNVKYIANLTKIGDTELDFLLTNNVTHIENYDTKDERDSTYNNFINNFVVDSNSNSNNSNNSNSNNGFNNSNNLF